MPVGYCPMLDLLAWEVQCTGKNGDHSPVGMAIGGDSLLIVSPSVL